MNKARWVSATAGAAMIAATLVLPGVAYASGNGNVTGNGNVSVLSGNTIDAPISLPVNLCGVSLGIVGFANSGCQGGASSNVSTAPSDDNGDGGSNGNGNVTGVGNIGIGSGNTVTAPVSAPVNVCGVSGGVAGYANSGCQGGAHSNVDLSSGGHGDHGGNDGNGNGNGNGNVTGVGNISGVSGNTIDAPVSAPINLCSVSLALLGFSNSGCQGGATTNVTSAPGGNGNVTGVGNVGLISGNTVNAPVSAPVNVCGVSVAAGGFANSGCQGGAEVNPPSCQDDHCTPPSCHGDHCTPCQDQMCTCHDGHCVPCNCQGSHCTPPPGCQGSHCTPPPGCQGSHCTPPPGCQGSHCTPGNQGTGPNGTGPGSTTTVTSATMPNNGILPTTGADLLLLGVAAVGTIGVGAGAITVARRRRSGVAS